VFLQHFGDHMPRGAYLQFYWNDSPVNDGNYIHPIPLQMLVAGRGGPCMLSCWPCSLICVVTTVSCNPAVPCRAVL
jgi:hypothetical protein